MHGGGGGVGGAVCSRTTQLLTNLSQTVLNGVIVSLSHYLPGVYCQYRLSTESLPYCSQYLSSVWLSVARPSISVLPPPEGAVGHHTTGNSLQPHSGGIYFKYFCSSLLWFCCPWCHLLVMILINIYPFTDQTVEEQDGGK